MTSTIHGLVYNALKLFMEINPTLFDMCTNEFKQQRQLERQKLRDRDEAWQRLRDTAIENSKAMGVEIPKTLEEGQAAPAGSSTLSDTDSIDSNGDLTGGGASLFDGVGNRSNGEVSTTDFEDAEQGLEQHEVPTTPRHTGDDSLEDMVS